ncbi:MAG: hypothetical protein ACRD15_07240, partial [Vicinamibacterales bacterium]
MVHLAFRHAALVLSLAVVPQLTASQAPDTASSVLPELALEGLPPPVRESINAAYADARAEPRDA